MATKRPLELCTNQSVVGVVSFFVAFSNFRFIVFALFAFSMFFKFSFSFSRLLSDCLQNETFFLVRLEIFALFAVLGCIFGVLSFFVWFG